MKHVTLKPFGWYPDGFTREALDVGAERDFGTSAHGMKAAGMIGEISPVQSIPVVDVPIAVQAVEIAPVVAAAAKELDSAPVEVAEVAAEGPVFEMATAQRRGRKRK